MRMTSTAPTQPTDFSGAGIQQYPQLPASTHLPSTQPHPHANAGDFIYMLKVPINVARGNAILQL